MADRFAGRRPPPINPAALRRAGRPYGHDPNNPRSFAPTTRNPVRGGGVGRTYREPGAPRDRPLTMFPGRPPEGQGRRVRGVARGPYQPRQAAAGGALPQVPRQPAAGAAPPGGGGDVALPQRGVRAVRMLRPQQPRAARAAGPGGAARAAKKRVIDPEASAMPKKAATSRAKQMPAIKVPIVKKIKKDKVPKRGEKTVKIKKPKVERVAPQQPKGKKTKVEPVQTAPQQRGRTVRQVEQTKPAARRGPRQTEAMTPSQGRSRIRGEMTVPKSTKKNVGY